TLYAGTSGGLFKTTNSGAAWNGLPLGLPVIKSLAIAPDASILYAGASSGFARSRNRGTNWTVLNNGLANLSVNALALDPTTPSTVYAGTDGGLFKSANGGTNWMRLTNLTYVVIYVGTNGVAHTNTFTPAVAALALDPSAPA